MTITDEIRATNGHAKGRAVGEQPTITLSSGYTIGLRRQPGDVMAQAQIAAQTELDSERPQPPTQKLETEPGVWRDIPNDHDPDYLAARVAWEARTQTLTTEKLLKLMVKVGLVFDVDHEMLNDLRTTYQELGIPLPEDDRTAYLSYVIAPTHEDQARLFMEVYGKGLPTEQQVVLHRRMFPGNLERHTD